MPTPRPYANPYIAGAGLGLVLLAAFVFAGRGLGASGAFASVTSAAVASIAPERAQANTYFSQYLSADGGLWSDWLVIEIIGVLIGGLLSARLAGRWRIVVERGASQRSGARLISAAAGGTLMGVGAVLARGCTSGLGLTGGALLSAGSWLFIATAFAAAYAITPFVRRGWS